MAQAVNTQHLLGGVVRIDGRDVRMYAKVQEDHAGHFFYNMGRQGGADRSMKALPAAGTVDNSGERSAPSVGLNPNQLPGDRSGPTPGVDVSGQLPETSRVTEV
jgi:hypothetical protein